MHYRFAAYSITYLVQSLTLMCKNVRWVKTVVSVSRSIDIGKCVCWQWQNFLRLTFSRCGSLLWLNVLFAGNWGWRHWEPFYLPYHIPALVIEWQGHTCSFLLGTKPLWHWLKWKSGPTSNRDPRPRYRPTGKCPLYRCETTGQLLHSKFGSNQVGCICTWQRSLSFETNTGATEKVPATNQSWRGCNHPTSNWPYQGHQIPCLVPRTTDWLSPLWSNSDLWPYAAGVWIVTGMSWWILHSRMFSSRQFLRLA